jgi:hypothetical protein
MSAFASKRSFLLLAACAVTGVLWAAEDPFVGEWKLNPSKSTLTDQMKVESLGGKKYEFDFGGGQHLRVRTAVGGRVPRQGWRHGAR